jgi:5'-3' exonuclease
MTTAIFSDGNWMLHRAAHAVNGRSSYPERKAPLLMLGWFCDYVLKFNATHGSLCFDGPSNFRYEVYSEYKKSRRDKRLAKVSAGEPTNSVYDWMAPTVRLFNLANLPVFQNAKYEADDLMAAGAFHWSSLLPNNRSYLIAPDKDLLQTVTDRVRVFSPEIVGQNKKPKLYDYDLVKSERGFSPKQFADFQILTGDKVDDIPSICSPRLAKTILKDYGSLKNFFKTEVGALFFKDNHQPLIRNQQLVRLAKHCWQPTPEELSLHPTDLNDSIILAEFGSLPSSFTTLRSVLKPKKQLF